MLARRFVAWIASVWASGLMVIACAHQPPPPLHSSRLLVERSNGAVRAFVRAKVAGEPMTLLLDTGAARSILPLGFARAHNLARQSRDSDQSFVDANGWVRKMQLATGVPVPFEGEAGAGTLDFLINPAEANTEAILAPQDVLRPGWTLVIDLGREEIRYEPEEVALKRLGGQASPPIREVDFHRCLHEGLFERSLHRFVTATINGVSASMLVDTGASRTVLTRNNPALRSMFAVKGSRSTTQAVTSTGPILIVDDVPIMFSQTSFVLPVMVHPTTPMCGHGALGADLLRQCTLVWGWSSLWSACRAPAETDHSSQTDGAPKTESALSRDIPPRP